MPSNDGSQCSHYYGGVPSTNSRVHKVPRNPNPNSVGIRTEVITWL